MLRFILVLSLLLIPSLALAQKIERVSVNNSGDQANGMSEGCYISADGRFVAFRSAATNLTAEGKAGIFVHDRQNGRTEYIGPGDFCHGISANGRYVLFVARLEKNTPGQLYVRNRVTRKTEIVSVTSNGVRMGAVTDHPGTAALSANGLAIVFLSPDPTLLRGKESDDSGVYNLAYVRDRRTHKTECVSVNDKGQVVHTMMCHGVAISSDGRFVALQTSGLLTADPDQGIFVRDRKTRHIERVNLDGKGLKQPAGDCRLTISDSGRYVCFALYRMLKTNRHGPPFLSDIYLRDRTLHTTEHISASTTEGFANESANYGSVSPDGRFATFISSATNLTEEDVNNGSTGLTYHPEKGWRNISWDEFLKMKTERRRPSIFLRDRRTKSTERISYQEGVVSFPSLSTVSADGRFVAFISPASFAARGGMDGQVLVCDRFSFAHLINKAIKPGMSLREAAKYH
jgi:hypothetical protein